MGEQYLTMAEIEKLYPNEWVLIDRPTSTKRRPETVTGGYVVLHTPDRAEIDRRLYSLRDGELLHFACLYIGEPPDEEEWLDPVAGEQPR
jgi:hypothetical protein